jgi:myo-inositol-1(or 4)-monophosphatase
MISIDTRFVTEQVRAVGDHLKQGFEGLSPVAEATDMLAAFREKDGAAADALRSALAAAYPEIGWIEGELDDGDAIADATRGARWVFDAIDGAVQYLRAIPHWAVSLALLVDGEPRFCAVYDAMHGEMFEATSGGGARLNGGAIHVNGRASHALAIVATSHPPFVGKDPGAVARAAASLGRLLPDVLAIRNLGPTSLQIAYVACGRLDAFYEHGSDGFNCIGPSLLVREAGGVVTDSRGAPYGVRSDGIVLAPPGVHASLLRRLNPEEPCGPDLAEPLAQR